LLIQEIITGSHIHFFIYIVCTTDWHFMPNILARAEENLIYMQSN